MPRWTSLVLPREHGIWGLLAGAALVGLPQAHDLAGLPLLGAALAGVVLRQAMLGAGCAGDRALVLVFAILAAGGGVLATAVLAGERAWWPWLAAAAVTGAPMVVPVPGRPWWSSALGAVPAGLLAAALAVAGGAGAGTAAVVAAALAVHLVGAVPLVRAQTRGGPLWSGLAVEVHIIAVLLAVSGWAAGLIAWGIPAVFGLGLARAAFLADKRTPMSSSPALIGARELAWLPVLAAGVHFGLRSAAC